MAKHMEDVVDYEQLMMHLRVARHTYMDHYEHMTKIADAGGHGDLITEDGARLLAENHKESMQNCDEMMEALEEWYYEGDDD